MNDSTSGVPARGSDTSPFEAIRRVDEDGEHWFARELQSVMDYSVWRDFLNAIEKAITSCRTSEHDVAANFAEVRKDAGHGPAPLDYRLSRFACYLIAMNGFTTKKAVADAQTYFAVKTRQAETAQPAVNPADITRRDLALMVVAEADRADAEKARADVAEQRNAVLEPKAAAADALMEAEGAVSMGAVANAYGIGRKALFDMLRAEDIIQKDRRPYQQYAAWFRVTIRQYDDSNGVPRPYVNTRVYPAGALRLHALLTKRGRELRKPQFDNQLSLLDGGAA